MSAPDIDEDEGPVGFIRPPDKLREKIDKTAMFVAKNGPAFEEKIKNDYENKTSVSFSFLFPGDQFNAYYRYKVKEIRNSLLQNLETKPVTATDQEVRPEQPQQSHDNVEHRQVPNDSNNDDRSDAHQRDDNNTVIEENRDQMSSQHQDEDDDQANAPRVRLKLNEYIQEMNIKLEEPPNLNYLATCAPQLTSMDCDVIKLTAQYISKYGRAFLLELVSREQNNSQFDFLKPQHGQFSYMTNLIMQYALIRNQPLDLRDQLSKDSNSQKHVLSNIKMRAEWNRMLELKQKKLEEAEEKEKLLYGQIDWQDFVIVETIDYQPDERGEYPPTTADQVGTRLLMQQRLEDHNVPEEMEIDMDTDDDN